MSIFMCTIFGQLSVTVSTSRPGQSRVSLQMTAVILSLQITD